METYKIKIEPYKGRSTEKENWRIIEVNKNKYLCSTIEVNLPIGVGANSIDNSQMKSAKGLAKVLIEHENVNPRRPFTITINQ